MEGSELGRGLLKFLLALLVPTLAFAREEDGPPPICRKIISRTRFLSMPRFDPSHGEALESALGGGKRGTLQEPEKFQKLLDALVSESANHEVFSMFWNAFFRSDPLGYITPQMMVDTGRAWFAFNWYLALRLHGESVVRKYSGSFPGAFEVIDAFPRSWMNYNDVFGFFHFFEKRGFALQPLVKQTRSGFRIALDNSMISDKRHYFQLSGEQMVARLQASETEFDVAFLPENAVEGGASMEKFSRNSGIMGSLAFAETQSEDELRSHRAIAAAISRVRKRVQPSTSSEVIGDDRFLAQLAIGAHKYGITHFFTNDNPLYRLVGGAPEWSPEETPYFDDFGRLPARNITIRDPLHPDRFSSFTVVNTGDSRSPK